MAAAATILAVEANRRNLELLLELLRRHGYETMGVAGLEDLDRALGAEPPDLVLMDVVGLDSSLWDRCQRMRDAGIPFVLISKPAAGGQPGLTHGAEAVLTKPLVAKELLEIVRSLVGDGS